MAPDTLHFSVVPGCPGAAGPGPHFGNLCIGALALRRGRDSYLHPAAEELRPNEVAELVKGTWLRGGSAVGVLPA